MHYKEKHQISRYQDDLLSTLPFYPVADETRDAHIIKTPVDFKGNYINEFCITPKGVDPHSQDPTLNHLVLVHGYGAGLGYYICNYDAISQYLTSNNWVVHAIDLLGYGASSRPKFPTHLSHDELPILESWFTDSIKTWCQLRNLQGDRTLFALHSLGAYLSLKTIMKFPTLFKKLIMISPALISMPNPPPAIPTWFKLLWEQNISPFILVRNTGPFGSLFVSGWSSRRFAKLNTNLLNLLHNYSYLIFNAPGSGEYLLNYVLAPGGVPRKPLENLITDIKCDLTWIYGEDDWMDLDGGKRANDLVNEKTQYNSDYNVVKNSGHHIYLDNITDFNQLIINELQKF